MSSSTTSSIPVSCNSNLPKNLNQAYFSNLSNKNDNKMNPVTPSPRKNAAAKHALKLSIPKPPQQIQTIQLNNNPSNYITNNNSDKHDNNVNDVSYVKKSINNFNNSANNINSSVANNHNDSLHSTTASNVNKTNSPNYNCDGHELNNKNHKSEVEKLIKGERNVDKSSNDYCLNELQTDNDNASVESLPTPSVTIISEASTPADNDIIDMSGSSIIEDDLCSCSPNGLISLPTYPKFESDLRKRIDEMNSPNKFDMHVREHSPMFTHIKSVSSSTPNTPSRTSPKPHFSRIISLSPTIHYNIEHTMPELSEITVNSPSPEMASILENLQKQKLNSTTNSRQNVINSSTSTSSVKELSTSSQQVLNSSTSSTKSSTTTSRVAKTSSSQRLHHVTSSSSSSSMSTSEMKARALKRDLNDMQNSMSEINTLALRPQASITNDLKNTLQERLKLEALGDVVDVSDTQPLITDPDENGGISLELELQPSQLACINSNELALANEHLNSVDTVKFEEQRMTSASKTKFITDGFSSEKATTNSSEMKRLQAGDIDYKEATAAAAVRNKIEVDGIKAEQNAAVLKEARSFKSGDLQQQETNNRAAASMQIHSNTFSAEEKAMKQSQQRQTVTSGGMFNQQSFASSASQSNFKITKQGISSSGSSIKSTSQSSSTTNGHLMLENSTVQQLEDLEKLCTNSSQKEVDMAITKYSNFFDSSMKSLQSIEQTKKVPNVLDSINAILQKAWAVPTYGHDLGNSLCNTLRSSGGLDLLVDNCVDKDDKLQFSSARLLEQCLTTDNRSYVVANGLEKVVNGACVCTKNLKTDHSRVGTGILEHLFKDSEGTCSEVIRLGGLDAVLFECRKNDIETLRHCAMALANLSLYGGADNQEAMINRKVPMWLFPLAFHHDDNIKYYACLAIAVLVANKEIEAEVLKSGTLDLVEPFVTSHNPSEFAKSNLAHAHGQSKFWLQRLVPVLSSNREEARNLATFHFCMEAGIKKEQGNTSIFREIGAIEPLKIVASCPNAIASKFAAQALRLIGEEVPHKLSQQVPLWSVEDVREWVKQIGFAEYEKNFFDSRVDGDLLLQLNEENLRDDLGIINGIRRRRFKRELENLKKMADYSSKDIAKISHFLQSIGPEFSIYTYAMLNAGVDKESLKNLTDEQLLKECDIINSIHRFRILNTIKCLETSLSQSTEDNMDKTLDVFVSYRRSNGSQLASLLKVHLQLRGFSVFIDVERLEAGKFDNNLLNSIRQAKHFILVLTPRALDRCIEDVECKDWVHREIVAALTSNCNIIPIIDNFSWPDTEALPEDMRSVCHFNGVRWIHDYQDACVDKLERFMRGEREQLLKAGFIGIRGDATPSTPSTASTTVRQNPLNYQRMHSSDSDKDNTQSGRSSD